MNHVTVDPNFRQDHPDATAVTPLGVSADRRWLMIDESPSCPYTVPARYHRAKIINYLGKCAITRKKNNPPGACALILNNCRRGCALSSKIPSPRQTVTSCHASRLFIPCLESPVPSLPTHLLVCPRGPCRKGLSWSQGSHRPR